MRKTINGYTIYFEDGLYHIIHKGQPFASGPDTEDYTHSQVYDICFPPNERDGVIYEDLTLAMIHDSSFTGCTIFRALGVYLAPVKVGYSQYGYALNVTQPRNRKASRYTFNERPRIVATAGAATVPETVLYDIEERNGVTTTTSKFLSFDPASLDAVTDYYDSQGIAWFEL